MDRALLGFATASLLFSVVRAGDCQSQPIPKRQQGIVLSGKGPASLEVFLDLQCPDSKAAWRTLQRVASELDSGDKGVRITFHHLPLPYHSNAFVAAYTAHIISVKRGTTAFFEAVNYIFDHQEEFSPPAAMDLTPAQALDYFGGIAEKFGVNRAEFTHGYRGALNMEVRTAWKFGVSRGVHSTPYFVLNGVFAVDPASDWPTARWLEYLQPYTSETAIPAINNINVDHPNP